MGFRLKPSGNLPQLRQCVQEQLAKGRIDHAFWRGMASAGESGVEPQGQRKDPPPALSNPPASVSPPAALAPCGSAAEGKETRVPARVDCCVRQPRGQKRSREEMSHPPAANPSPVANLPPASVSPPVIFTNGGSTAYAQTAGAALGAGHEGEPRGGKRFREETGPPPAANPTHYPAASISPPAG